MPQVKRYIETRGIESIIDKVTTDSGSRLNSTPYADILKLPTHEVLEVFYQCLLRSDSEAAVHRRQEQEKEQQRKQEEAKRKTRRK